jgi:hypothetical protein
MLKLDFPFNVVTRSLKLDNIYDKFTTIVSEFLMKINFYGNYYG